MDINKIASNPDSLTNLEYLEQLSDGDTEWIIGMITMFIENTPDSINSMRIQYAHQNWPTLQRLAHTLKAQFKMLGIDSLAETILNIEMSAKNVNNIENIPELIEKTEEVCQKTFNELNAKLITLKGKLQG